MKKFIKHSYFYNKLDNNFVFSNDLYYNTWEFQTILSYKLHGNYIISTNDAGSIYNSYVANNISYKDLIKHYKTFIKDYIQ